MRVPMQILSVACGLLLPLVPVLAQSDGDMVVRRIVVDGTTREQVEGALQIALRGPDGKDNHRLTVGEIIGPGTRISTGASVLIEVTRARPVVRIVLEPRTRLTVQMTTPNMTQVDLAEGKASFNLISRLDFYFAVTSFRKVFAIAKGTQFSDRKSVV